MEINRIEIILLIILLSVFFSSFFILWYYLKKTKEEKRQREVLRVCFLKGFIPAYSLEVFLKSYYTCTAPKYILLVQFLSYKESYPSSESRLRLSQLLSSSLVIHMPRPCFLQNSWFLVFYLTIYPIFSCWLALMGCVL